MLEPRSNFSVAILNNQLLVMGGMDADGRDCNRVDIYCPATNRFFFAFSSFDKICSLQCVCVCFQLESWSRAADCEVCPRLCHCAKGGSSLRCHGLNFAK